MKNEYKIFIGIRHKGKRPLGIPRRRWKENIKIDLMEIGLEGEE
jgi:hypothetical protein